MGWVLEGFIGIGVVKDPVNAASPGADKGIRVRSPALMTLRYALDVEVVEFTKEEIGANAEYIRDKTWIRLEEILTPELIAGFRSEVEKLKQ